MESQLPASTMTATVIDGVTTNRIRVKRKRGRPPATPKPPRSKSAGTAMVRYKSDPSVRGLDCVVIAISIPAGELEQLDAWADRTQMARSHFIRQAVKHFGAKVCP